MLLPNERVRSHREEIIEILGSKRPEFEELAFENWLEVEGQWGRFLVCATLLREGKVAQKMAQDRATDDLSPRGAGRNRTDESRFCRPLPYHLATAPGYTGLELTSSEAVGEPSDCAATVPLNRLATPAASRSWLMML